LRATRFAWQSDRVPLNYWASRWQACACRVVELVFPYVPHRLIAEDLMASNESNAPDSSTDTAVAEQGAEEQEYTYDIKIEDAGPATKKVVVQIPKERVAEKLTEQFKEIRQQAAIPGFRPGHAPQKLVEKRFGDDVKDQVRRSLISESYSQAVEKNSLNVIGEPEFDNPEAIQLKEAEGLSYSFQIEVQPEIEIPDLKGLKVKRPKIEVNDTNVDQAMQNLREQQGTLVPVEDRGVEDKDNLSADITIKLGNKEIMNQPDAQFVSRPGRIAGVDVVDLDKQLKGMKPGETRTIKVKVPDTHPQEEVRGKDIEVTFNLKDIKRLELAEIDAPFLESLGFTDEKELREALREQMVERINYDVQQSMREQVNKHLLDNVKIELPTRLSTKQTDRVVNRRAVDLMMRGMQREQIEQQIEQLRHGAKDEAVRELKLFFILQKIAADKNVDVDESELNGRIAMLAAQRGQRPEKMRQTMAKDGTLSNMYVQMREQKALDEILKDAQVEEIDLQADQANKTEEKSEEKKG
jgi:trigger factor